MLTFGSQCNTNYNVFQKEFIFDKNYKLKKQEKYAEGEGEREREFEYHINEQK